MLINPGPDTYPFTRADWYCIFAHNKNQLPRPAALGRSRTAHRVLPSSRRAVSGLATLHTAAHSSAEG